MNFLAKLRHPKTTATLLNASVNTQIKTEVQHQRALKDSLVIVGPEDVGKSVFGRNFAKKYGLVYINLENAFWCKHDINSLKELRSYYSFQSRFCDRPSVTRRMRAEARIANDDYEYRAAFPNALNLTDTGYDPILLEHIKLIDSFDDICVHTFKKHYENIVLKSIIDTASEPFVLDTCTRTPISLYRDYKKRIPIILADYELGKDTKYASLTNYLHKIDKDLDTILHGLKDNTADACISKVENIVAMEYNTQTKAPKNRLNKLYIATGQYQNVAKNHTMQAGFIQEDQNGFACLNKTRMIEDMSYMMQYMQANNPELTSTIHEIEITF